MKIGWIGLGKMGVPMVKNLIRAGFTVTLFNRTPEKYEEFVPLGARFVETKSQLLELCDVIITMVSDDQAVKEVYTGEDGLLAGVHPGKIAVDMSTVSPTTSQSIAESCQKHGIRFLDAPVSGSVQPAQDGSLLIMVGGAVDAFETMRPVFDALGKMAIHLGDHGAGNKAKLAINLLLGITIQGIAESVLFAQENGINPKDMLTIINESAVGTAISRAKSDSILRNEFPAVAALKHYAKDLRLAKETGSLKPLSHALHDSYQEALQSGFGDLDIMAIIKFLGEQR